MDNDVVTQQTQAPKNKFLIPFLIVLVLVAVFEFVLLLKKDGKLPTAASTSVEEISKAPEEMEGIKEGSLTLSVDNNTNIVVGSPFTVTVNADSNGHSVVAFDAILQYDNTAFTLGSVSSTVDGFSATSNSSRGYLDITSSKSPQTTATPVFKDASVLTLTLIPQKSGSYKINLLKKIDKASAKFVDTNTKIFLPTTGSVDVMVK